MQSTKKSPHDCIGLVLTFFKNDETPFYGTGFLVGENKVLTVAHNICMKIRLNNPIADKVYFISAVNGLVKNEEAIAVTHFNYCPDFSSK